MFGRLQRCLRWRNVEGQAFTAGNSVAEDHK